MSSEIIPIHGNYAERQRLRDEAVSGLFSGGSSGSTRFYTREEEHDWSHSDKDVVVVSGKHHHVHTTFEDEENGLDFYTIKHGYLSPNYLVRLDRPDTVLYYVESMLPKYNAELGQVQMLKGILLTAITFAGAGAVSLILGYGWVSVFLALGAALCMFVWRFSVRDRFWTLIAALKVCQFVLRRVLFESHSLEHYRELIRHLGESDEFDVRRVHRLTKVFIRA